MTKVTPASIAYVATQVRLIEWYHVPDRLNSPSGSVRPRFVASLLEVGHRNGFRALLQFGSGLV